MPEFIAENRLEELLMQGAKNPAMRPQFMKELLDAQIYILPAEDLVMKDGVTIGQQQLQLQTLKKGEQNFTPFFTSPSRISAVITEETKYYAFKGKTFLEMTKGSYLVLNPGSGYGKEFFPDEVADLLNGDLGPGKYVVDKKTEILISMPAQYPDLLVETVTKAFKKMPEVKAAFLAQYFNPGRGGDGHILLLGLELKTENALPKISAETGNLIKDQKFHPHHKYVDIVSLANDAWPYFKSVKPFYKKSKLGFFS